MKLNLGCGEDIRQGYVNVDFRDLRGVNRVVDLSKFPWPFADSSADEILMLDFLEHFPYRQTMQILLECHRILKKDGELHVQVPDADHTMMALCQEGDYLCNRCGGKMFDRLRGDVGFQLEQCPQCGQSADDISEAAMGRLYGGQDYIGNFHHTCFTSRSLEQKALKAGFTLKFDDCGEHYWRNWTLYKIFSKGDVW